ncbi:2-amino-3,7-dideoxy-D-threo-hept-6-ulosonate synthase [Actinoplanes derwentensis]|uniref:2-amino-4,5-dihydroxy-6-oxo-7-(Phosphonooxy)heptanoate synthase n=1 Tax=Actinoplanes derwentensis TaxID=113562 RepID=A0A1H2C835_9ACTN|nr:2-amino-3,7-dideoxy-D-threo-hept-6-ulosonate synthase [Actinoplanes derwentensis]GID86522.1 fructose-bisphosphate aldolase [Actinoplanes derwentensis]SDT66705.1 2-amino-4,5-dihydroxy-6-oxo-7-(phosphonooxy)heptanoate synthase [Actinoplanes derwentensis]
MYGNESFGRRLRLGSLHRRGGSGLLLVPLDHAVGSGPLRPAGDLDALIARLAENGADGVVLHKGAVRRVRPARFRDLSLTVQLNASTAMAADPDAKYPVATVEEALRLGAHAVSVHVNMASRTEAAQIAHLARVAEDCDRWSVPLLAMMYVRGPAVRDSRSADLVAHAVAVAAEMGADLVKTALPENPEATARLLTAAGVPVLAAGGVPEPGPEAVLGRMSAAMRAGAAGVAVGRLVFTAVDPAAVVRRLSAVVHDRTPVAVG